jgi:hypothetical protein
VTIEAEPAPVEWTFFYRTLRAYLDVIDRLLRGEAQPVHLTLSRAEAEAVAGMLETFSGCEANPLVRQLGSRLEAIVHELKA